VKDGHPDVLRLMEEHSPFNRLLGMKGEALEPGHAVIVLPVREDLVGDPPRGVTPRDERT
jgi:acyl-coenzyme A thioesterase PaaI-like protein